MGFWTQTAKWFLTKKYHSRYVVSNYGVGRIFLPPDFVYLKESL